MENIQSLLFWIIAPMTGACAIAVVVSQNIVRSATWLLFTLAGVSGIFFLIGADFVGATQLLVYVGGTLVLVVFGVMLTAQGPFITMKTSAAEWAVAMLVGLTFFGVLAISTLNAVWPEPPKEQRMGNAQSSMSSVVVGAALAGFPEASPRKPVTVPGTRQERTDDRKPEDSKPEQVTARSNYRERTQVAYLLPFEIVSVHLLVVLLGAAYLARAKRRRGTTTG